MKHGFGCFVTGTDTEIGKTLIASALLHLLTKSGVRAIGMKPVAAGTYRRSGELINDDAELLAAASPLHLPRSLTTPYLLNEPAAPHHAAALEGITISLDRIMESYTQLRANSDAIVVEGVGGFRVPLSASFDTADLAVRLNLPVVLVVGMRLGCLNHALLTAEAIAARGLPLLGWVANLMHAEMAHAPANIDTLEGRLNAPLLGVIPSLSDATATNAAQYLRVTDLAGWPRADR